MMEFHELWEKLNFTAYGSAEDVLIEDFKKVVAHFHERRERIPHSANTLHGYFSYNYEEIGEVVGHMMYGWTLINMLANADFIDWGTSIRNGWTTKEGTEFFQYIEHYSTEVLCEAADSEELVETVVERLKENKTAD